MLCSYLPTVPFPIARAEDTQRCPPLVSKMVRSDFALGVMFSIDTETGFKMPLITAAYGLGKTWFKEPSTPMNTLFLSRL